METHRPRRRRQETRTDRADLQSSALEATAAATRHPMGSPREWAADVGTLGASAGLSLALTCLAVAPSLAGASPLAFALLTPLLIGIAGAFAGATAGAILRALRGRVHAVVGVLLAACGANMVGSALTLARPEALALAAGAIEGRAGPLSLAVLALIPAIAVLRHRGQRTLPWMVLVGALTGALIGLSPL